MPSVVLVISLMIAVIARASAQKPGIEAIHLRLVEYFKRRAPTHPSPASDRRRTPLSHLVALLMICLSLSFHPGFGAAHAHDPSRPELNAWFKSLKNTAGERCCDGGDGEHAQTDWDMAKRGYKVLLKNPQRPDEPGQWFNVPNDVVLDRPNLSGRAMIWWWPSYELDGTMTPNWRCFIPGPAG